MFASCTDDVLQRDEYLRNLRNIEGTDIHIRRRLFETGRNDQCAIELTIEIERSGNGWIVWTRPVLDSNSPITPCFSGNSEKLREVKFQLNKHNLLRIERSLARLHWGSEFDELALSDFNFPLGCSLVMDASSSHNVSLEKEGKWMHFAIQPSCRSRQVPSGQLLIDDAIRLLPIERDLMP
tara:strand:+ start:595 stop:1137 length:543 start_codon:yes stop_codon:yes gene_type:complete